MPGLGNRIDKLLLDNRQRLIDAVAIRPYDRGTAIRRLLILVHNWHAHEKGHQVDSNYEVRERNRLRAREMEGPPPTPSEDAWREAGLDAKLPKKKEQFVKFPKRWDFEHRPATRVGLILSRMVLSSIYGGVFFLFLSTFLAFGGLILICSGLTLRDRVMAMIRPNPAPVVQNTPGNQVKPENKPPENKPPENKPPEKPKEQPMAKPALRFSEPPNKVAVEGGQPRLKSQSTTIDDAVFTSIAPAPGLADWCAWTRDGRGLYFIGREGRVARVDADSLEIQRFLKLDIKIAGFALSAKGLVLVCQDTLYLLDPDLLDVKRQIDIPRVTQALSAPTLSRVVALRNDNTGLTFDLEKEELEGEFSFRSDPRTTAALTADGNYLFTIVNGAALARHRLEGGKFVHEQTGPNIGKGIFPTGINFSADGKLVALPTEESNLDQVANHPSTTGKQVTFVYAVGDLTRPAFVLEPQANLRGVAFDLARNQSYGTRVSSLMVHDMKGQLSKQYSLPMHLQNWHGCRLNPTEHKLLLTEGLRYCIVTWPDP